MSGTYDVESRWNGGAWSTIDTDATGTFSGSLAAQTQGQGRLDVRLVGVSASLLSAEYVGIGDVFGVWGQSNARGQGENFQSYSSATLKAACFQNSYLWEELNDPSDNRINQVDIVSQDGVNEGGSAWLPLATSFLADQDVPIAFVPCAKGGTVISDWQPGIDHEDRTTLYGSGNYRLQQTGCKAVLWWQGESDASVGTTEANYNTGLDTIADTINSDLGVPLIACKLYNLEDWGGGVDETAVNAAIATAWGDNANVLQGPDFSDIIPSVDGLHAVTDAEIATAASRWWSALQTLFYP